MNVNTVNQLLTYSKQAEAGIHQKAIQMLLGAGNKKTGQFKYFCLNISNYYGLFIIEGLRMRIIICCTNIFRKTVRG